MDSAVGPSKAPDSPPLNAPINMTALGEGKLTQTNPVGVVVPLLRYFLNLTMSVSTVSMKQAQLLVAQPVPNLRPA